MSLLVRDIIKKIISSNHFSLPTAMLVLPQVKVIWLLFFKILRKLNDDGLTFL